MKTRLEYIGCKGSSEIASIFEKVKEPKLDLNRNYLYQKKNQELEHLFFLISKNNLQSLELRGNGFGAYTKAHELISGLRQLPSDLEYIDLSCNTFNDYTASEVLCILASIPGRATIEMDDNSLFIDRENATERDYLFKELESMVSNGRLKLSEEETNVFMRAKEFAYRNTFFNRNDSLVQVEGMEVESQCKAL